MHFSEIVFITALVNNKFNQGVIRGNFKSFVQKVVNPADFLLVKQILSILQAVCRLMVHCNLIGKSQIILKKENSSFYFRNTVSKAVIPSGIKVDMIHAVRCRTDNVTFLEDVNMSISQKFLCLYQKIIKIEKASRR